MTQITYIQYSLALTYKIKKHEHKFNDKFSDVSSALVNWISGYLFYTHTLLFIFVTEYRQRNRRVGAPAIAAGAASSPRDGEARSTRPVPWPAFRITTFIGTDATAAATKRKHKP